MDSPHRDHPAEDALERFLRNQSPEAELEIVETHILACELCVSRLEALELQIAAVKVALSDFEADQEARDASKSLKAWKNWFSIPHLSWAGAAAAFALVFISFSVPRDVTVGAYRGLEMTTVSEWRPLHLHLNATDLAEGPVTVELVDARGTKIWQGASVIERDQVDVRVPRIKENGGHFLRLYASSPANPEGELLREYAIRVKWTF